MRDKKVLINTASLVKDFVNSATKVEGPVKLVSEDGYSVNGKSIMGIFSLNLTKPLYVQTESQNKDFMNFLKKLEV